MGVWLSCRKCGGRVRRLKVMDVQEEAPSSEERVARSLMGIVSTKRMALQCIEERCGHVQTVRVNRVRKGGVTETHYKVREA
jgi:hypothetical protein